MLSVVMDLRPDMRIQIEGRPDILTIKNIKQTGSFTTLSCLLNEKDYKEIPLSESELDKITVLPDIQYDMKGDAMKLFLGIERKRFEMASVHEPLISMQNVDPVPHQIEAVYDYIMTYYHIRHMLAHDAGAGKTIMSGLIIKELKARGRHIPLLYSGSRQVDGSMDAGNAGQVRREIETDKPRQH